MRESLIDYARTIAPLQALFDKSLKSGKRTKRAAAGISIQLSAAERSAFQSVKELLARSATLAFPDDNAATCLFTDASDYGWAVIITQVQNWQATTDVTEQQHELLTCLSSTFTGSQCNWSVIEKEAFPIITACEKLDYLLLRPQGFHMYCDHRNLIHVFAPDKEVKKHVRGKLLRWALKLSELHYVVEHIHGPKNVWADMLSRWGGAVKRSVNIKRLTAKRKPKQRRTIQSSQVVLRPLDDENFIWPSIAELKTIQESTPPPAVAVPDEHGLYKLDGRIWVPPRATALIQRLCIIAHCGQQGHRGQAAMTTHLNRIFEIENLSATANKFVASCLMCCHVKGGRVVKRPWGETIDCNQRNGVLHFDFLYLGESFGEAKYLLVLKDHATHFVELTVCDSANSTATVEAILSWHSRYGVPPIWVSDNGSHFKNEVMSELRRRLKTQQQFTPAYCPWINGSIERVNRDILQVLRAMILEYKISTRDWIYLIPMVQSSLNHTPVPSLASKAPVELFTGLPCPSPLQSFYSHGKKEILQIPDDADKIEGENVVNFDVGDYVLRSRVDDKQGNKLHVTWTGPHIVVRADAHSFRVRHLVTGDESDVHASRLKFYADNSLNITEELLEHVAAQGTVLAVNELKEHRWNNTIKDYELRVNWRGLEPIEDSWEPITTLGKEIPTLVDDYVTKRELALQQHWGKVYRE
ncbi:hypothetical protein PHMEG_00019407 [Phytophthora megakarya]|uniref:Integrase catalytic domain-containing protein n=1 Tax=Phytophthora megakarya TaxID=4795 RepID=A0A225VRY4_9STRA|nr:hypothetical protein PHMEG_00019407 [Phytophthora megakarya]